MPQISERAAPLSGIDRRILAAIATRPANRTEICKATGLSRNTVTAAVTELLRRGLVSEDQGDASHRSVGRPAARLILAERREPFAVLELRRSGSILRVCASDGSIIHEAMLDLDVHCELDDLVTSLSAHLVAWEADVNALVLSIPLPFRPGIGVVPVRRLPHGPYIPGQGRVEYAGWLFEAFEQGLAERLGYDVIAENDANLAALGEAVHGAGRGSRTVLYICVKDGVGASTIIDGVVHRGASGVAGELAHVTVDDEGALCQCGNKGCIATLSADGPRLTATVSRAYGQEVTFEDLQRLARADDPGVVRVLTDVGRTLGKPLAIAAVFLDPELIVVDGKLGPAAVPLIGGLAESIAMRAPAMIRDTVEIVAGTLGDLAEVAGARWLVHSRHVAALLESA